MIIAYRWRGRMVVCHIIIGRVDVLWVLHFALHINISHGLRKALTDAFLVVTNHMSVLQYDTRGETTTTSDTVRNAHGPVIG